jgi:hypothetical protein
VNLRLETLKRLATTLKVHVRRLFEEPGTAHPGDARIRGLNDEDFQIARAFHDAPTQLRQRIAGLLSDGERDDVMAISKRLQRFSSEDISIIAGLITELERAHETVRAKPAQS